MQETVVHVVPVLFAMVLTVVVGEKRTTPSTFHCNGNGRRKPNLYAEDMVISKRLKGEEASHTKAVYELRRFVGRIKEAGDRAKQ